MAIKEEFLQLHQFLKDEEDMRLRLLKQEEEIKIQVMCNKIKNVEEEIKALNATISKVDLVLKAKDLPFLQVHFNGFGLISLLKELRLIANDIVRTQPHCPYFRLASLFRRYTL
ncbi:hypothetical protein ILYODFUR_002608 [Ilyodon furcidens]|uniref:Uncharacterized protein n=1 Tax=Ilyodon furcidens TaxID=33524 RepID=A0ABV0T6C3_9TELE